MWTVFWLGLSFLVVWYMALRENDQPIRYKVPPPKVPEKFEILENPAIKVLYRQLEVSTDI